MEEAIAERLTSQEPQTNQCQTSHNGSVGPSDTKRFEERPFFRICRDFMRGNCRYGGSCKFRHSESDKHDKASKENDPNVKPEFGHYRRRSPCRNFLRGRCNNGPNCRRLHIENNEVKEELRSHSVNRERRSRSPCRNFLRGRCNNGPNCSRLHIGNNEVKEELRSHSIHRERRSRSPCRKFLRGSCFLGSSCPYMHDEPKFDYSTKHQQGVTYVKDDARSTVNGDDMELASRDRSCGEFGKGEKIKEFCLKFSKGRCDRGDSCRYLHSFHEYAKSNPVPINEQPSQNIVSHHRVGNGSCLSEGIHNVNDSVSHDGTIDDSLNPNVLDRKRESQVIDRKGEADDDFSLWSRPFKRQRSWSEFQNNFKGHRDNNLVPFQYHHRSSYHRNWSRCRLDDRPHSKVTTSMNLPSRRVDKESNTDNPNRNSECEHVKDDIRLGIASLDSNNSILDQKTDISKGQVGVSSKEAEFESTCPCEYDTSLRNDDGEVSICLSQERVETSENMKNYCRKIRKVTCFKPSSSCCANNVLVIGASDEVENKETINEIRDNLEPASALMETSGSLIKEANLNFKRKLLILDVNGILADIVAYYPETFKPDTVVSMKGVFKRPFCDDFLEFCFERFDVGVWSSRNKKNVDTVTDFLMGDSKKKLLFCWDQSYCTDTGYKTVENKSKPLVLKELKRLWEKQVDDLPWEKGYYNETNTILLDDSPYKALLNPPYTAVFPFAFTFRDRKDTDLGPNGRLRLYLERLSQAENVQKFIQENPFGQRPITKSNLLWSFYSKIIEDYSTRNKDNYNITPVAS